MFFELMYGMINLLTLLLLPSTSKCLCDGQKLATSSHSLCPRAKNEKAHLLLVYW